jgi:hypothetical protein
MNRTALLLVGGAIVIGLALAGGWTLTSTDAPRTPQAHRPPTDERAPEAEEHRVGELPAIEAAARRFLSGYLRVVYGKPGASIDDIRSAAPRLIASLNAEGARVTPAQAQKTPHVRRVAIITQGAIGALATAQIKDSPQPAYPLILQLQRTTAGWLVTRIGGA